ncbi:MAG: glycerol-3-phosphate dehydrogenase/oxidase [Rudaea sp.]
MSRPINPLRTEFSQRTRAYNLARLRAELFDILVIGGGIGGAAIARDAVLRGYKVALVEKNDFGSGASSQSNKLVQGNIAYLETLDLWSLYRAAQERNRLLQVAPHHVWPLQFIHVIGRNDLRDPRQWNRRLFVYDLLSFARSSRRHHMLSEEQTCGAVPGLDRRAIAGGALFYEAQTDDSRLTLEVIRSAHRRGAVIVNHFQVEDLAASTGKRIDGVFGRDIFADEFITARARIVVNAAGPWADSILAMDARDHPSRQSLSRTVHILVPWNKFPIRQGVSFTNPDTQQLLFAEPYAGFSLVGPSERIFDGDPDAVHAQLEDIDLVLNSIRKAFPGLDLSRQDIISTFAGLRAQVAAEGGPLSGLVARDHTIWTTPAGLLNVVGGDLTTHRATAEEVVNHAAAILRHEFGVRPARPRRSARVPLVEWRGRGEVLTRAQADTFDSLSEDTRDYLSRTYGLRLGRLLDHVRSDARLRSPIVDGFPCIWAEVPHGVEQEMALSVSDMMMRRLGLFYLVRDGAIEAATEVARYMARLVDWMDPDVEQQILSYANAVNMNRWAIRVKAPV